MWSERTRRVLVLLTDQNLYPDTEVLADQAAQNGIEVIPVQFDNEFKWAKQLILSDTMRDI